MIFKEKTLIIILIFLLLFLTFRAPKTAIAICAMYTPQKTNSSGFYWGIATIEGVGDVRSGDVIRAYVDSVETMGGCVGEYKVNTPGYYGSMAIYMDDPTTNAKDGVVVGDTIHFTICHNKTEYLCNEVSTWKSQNAQNPIALNLTGSSEVKYEDKPEMYAELTSQDALCAFQIYLGKCSSASCSDCNELSYDINKDGKCTPKDALCIYRKSKRLSSCLDL